MPLLIKNVSGEILDNLTTNVDAITSLDGKFGYEDWFKIGYLEVFIQNYKKVVETEDLIKPNTYGLLVNNNKTFTEIEISY